MCLGSVRETDFKQDFKHLKNHWKTTQLPLWCCMTQFRNKNLCVPEKNKVEPGLYGWTLRSRFWSREYLVLGQRRIMLVRKAGFDEWGHRLRTPLSHTGIRVLTHLQEKQKKQTETQGYGVCSETHTHIERDLRHQRQSTHTNTSKGKTRHKTQD